jgi:uncharacterized membrane protein (DUF485 family)
MDERDIAIAVVLLPALVIVGGVVVMVAGIRLATRSAELQHQERIAMIERGMTPPDVAGGAARQRRAHGFKLSLGILLCGLGLGLVMLISFAAGAPGIGAGIGGAIVMVGLAFIVSAFLTERQGPSLEERMAARHAGRHGGPPAPPVRSAPLDPPPPAA